MKALFSVVPILLAAVAVCACAREGDREAAPAEGDPGAAPQWLSQAPPAAPTAPAAGGPAHYGIEIIDSHVHIDPNMFSLAQALEVFDKSGIGRFVAKSGGAWDSSRFWATVAMKRVLQDRFEFFCNIDWDDLDQPDFATSTAARLAQAAAAGAKGVKIFKNLGLRLRTTDGKLMAVDDPRLDPIFEKAGEIGFIVALHVADPVAFFQPVTPDNERYDELKIAPRWSFYGGDFPSHAELMAQQERRVARHPKTKFLLIHLAGFSENLDYVDNLLSKYGNVWVDTSARLPEIGRHPADKARAFFVKHQDRILFGSDFISSGSEMQLGSVSDKEPTVEDAIIFFNRHWRYLETDEKQIEHPTPVQGKWKVDAIALPPEVLRKLYRDNAEKLIFSPLKPLTVTGEVTPAAP
jgi:predicted TIM-barrel fold metal-dependent hydrolase